MCSRDVDVGVVVADKVDVGLGEIFAHELPSRRAGLVMPFQPTKARVVDQGHAGLVAEAVSSDGAVGLGLAVGSGGGPVIELQQKMGNTFGRKFG